MSRVRIPVNVRGAATDPGIAREAEPIVADARSPVSAVEDVNDSVSHEAAGSAGGQPPLAGADGHETGAQRGANAGSPPPAPADGNDWRDRALRLQAEMENYRKRQQRLAQDQIESERKRLLREFLTIVDDLERALAASASDGHGLRHGVELTLRAALLLLQREGVERVQEVGQPFDPNWHEAVTTVASHQAGVPPNTVAEVLEPGYRLQDQLLRPARVVVAM